MTFSIIDIQQNNIHNKHLVSLSFNYAESRIFYIVMLSVVMLNVVILNVVAPIHSLPCQISVTYSETSDTVESIRHSW
jgi:hypothetical protein